MTETISQRRINMSKEVDGLLIGLGTLKYYDEIGQPIHNHENECVTYFYCEDPCFMCLVDEEIVEFTFYGDFNYQDGIIKRLRELCARRAFVFNIKKLGGKFSPKDFKGRIDNERVEEQKMSNFKDCVDYTYRTVCPADRVSRWEMVSKNPAAVTGVVESWSRLNRVKVDADFGKKVFEAVAAKIAAQGYVKYLGDVERVADRAKRAGGRLSENSIWVFESRDAAETFAAKERLADVVDAPIFEIVETVDVSSDIARQVAEALREVEVDEEYSEKNPKIDLYVDGKYHCSTKYAKTVKAAIADFLKKYPNLKGSHISGSINKVDEAVVEPATNRNHAGKMWKVSFDVAGKSKTFEVVAETKAQAEASAKRMWNATNPSASLNESSFVISITPINDINAFGTMNAVSTMPPMNYGMEDDCVYPECDTYGEETFESDDDFDAETDGPSETDRWYDPSLELESVEDDSNDWMTIGEDNCEEDMLVNKPLEEDLPDGSKIDESKYYIIVDGDFDNPEAGPFDTEAQAKEWLESSSPEDVNDPMEYQIWYGGDIVDELDETVEPMTENCEFETNKFYIIKDIDFDNCIAGPFDSETDAQQWLKLFNCGTECQVWNGADILDDVSESDCEMSEPCEPEADGTETTFEPSAIAADIEGPGDVLRDELETAEEEDFNKMLQDFSYVGATPMFKESMEPTIFKVDERLLKSVSHYYFLMTDGKDIGDIVGETGLSKTDAESILKIRDTLNTSKLSSDMIQDMVNWYLEMTTGKDLRDIIDETGLTPSNCRTILSLRDTLLDQI